MKKHILIAVTLLFAGSIKTENWQEKFNRYQENCHNFFDNQPEHEGYTQRHTAASACDQDEAVESWENTTALENNTPSKNDIDYTYILNGTDPFYYFIKVPIESPSKQNDINLDSEISTDITKTPSPQKTSWISENKKKTAAATITAGAIASLIIKKYF